MASVRNKEKEQLTRLNCNNRSNGMYHLMVVLLNTLGYGFELAKPTRQGKKTLTRVNIAKVTDPSGAVVFDAAQFPPLFDGFQTYAAERRTKVEEGRCSRYRKASTFNTLLRLASCHTDVIRFVLSHKTAEGTRFVEKKVKAFTLVQQNVTFKQNAFITLGQRARDLLLDWTQAARSVVLHPYTPQCLALFSELDQHRPCLVAPPPSVVDSSVVSDSVGCHESLQPPTYQLSYTYDVPPFDTSQSDFAQYRIDQSFHLNLAL